MNELIQQLTKSLGIDPGQAQTGLASLFQIAESQLGTDFSKVKSALPGLDQLMKNAPQSSGGMMGLLGSAVSMLGSQSSMGQVAQVVMALKSANLDADTAMKFVPLVLDFVQKHAGDEVKSLLQNALTSKI